MHIDPAAGPGESVVKWPMCVHTYGVAGRHTGQEAAKLHGALRSGGRRLDRPRMDPASVVARLALLLLTDDLAG